MGNKETYVYKYNPPESVVDTVMEVISGPSYSLVGKEVERWVTQHI